MAKLIINPTSSSRRELSLARSVLSIGRDPANDLVLPDAMVSRRHAVIEYRGTQYFLRDCNSSNGSLVNGDRVAERGLRDGDLVAIGTARLLFRDDAAQVDLAAKVIPHPSAPRQTCPSCQTECRAGDLFCRQCGGGLAPPPPVRVVCTACGTAVLLPAHFCSACGRALPQAGSEPLVETPQEPAQHRTGTDADGASPPPLAAPVPPAAEAPRPAPAPPPPPPAPAVPPAPSLPRVRPPAASFRVGGPGAGPSRPRSPREVATGNAPPVGVPAGFGRRLLAFLVDGLVVGLGQTVLLGPAVLYWQGRQAAPPGLLPLAATLAALPVALAAGAAYYVLSWSRRSATPGQALLRIEVVGTDGARPLSPGRALVRFLGCVLSGLVFGVGFLMALGPGGALHDRLAGTRVVLRRR